VKRASVGALILAVVVLTGLGVAGSGIRYKPCLTCDDLSLWLRHHSSRISHRTNPRVGCPDCGDRGKVSLFRSWMPSRVSPSIAALVRAFKDPTAGQEPIRALRRVVEENGPAFSRFLDDAFDVFHGCKGVEFLEAEQKLYGVVFVGSGSNTLGTIGVSTILLSAEGRVLDFIDLTWNYQHGPLRDYVLVPAAADGAQILIDTYEERPNRSYMLAQWQKSARDGKPKGVEVCRYKIRNDRLEVLDDR
jgi:hypothetical protein